MVDIVSSTDGNLKITEKDVNVERFPNSKSKRLCERILKLTTEILEQVEKWEMIEVKQEELEETAWNIGKKKWRKSHQTLSLWWMEDIDATRLSAKIRGDLSMKNFKKWSVYWFNFFHKKRIIASIYELRWSQRILLNRSIAEHPTIAWKLIVLLEQKYNKVQKHTEK